MLNEKVNIIELNKHTLQTFERAKPKLIRGFKHLALLNNLYNGRGSIFDQFLSFIDF